VEDDGDLHVVMENTDGRRGRIVVELPVGRPWCKLRAAVFTWTNARFTLLPRDGDTMHAVWEIHPVMRLIQSVGPVF